MKKIVKTSKAPGAIGPYSQATVCGNVVYTSGQLGMDFETLELLPTLEEQTHGALKSLQAILEEAGSGMDCVLKATVFLSNMDDFAAVNEIYKQYFFEPYPARTAIQVAKLPKGGLVEIEAVAHLK